MSTSIESRAEESLNFYSDVNLPLLSNDLPSVDINTSFNTGMFPYYVALNNYSIGTLDLSDYFDLESNVLYSVDITTTLNVNSSRAIYAWPCATMLHFDDSSFYLSECEILDNESTLNYGSYTRKVFFYGNDSIADVVCSSVFYSNYSGAVDINLSVNFSFDNFCQVNSASSDDYQNGYNAGYADGETDGYDNGYSQGYLEGEESGFQAGQKSVDIQSYYDAGYNAGYSSGYQVAYNSGYNAGLEAGRNVNGTISDTVFMGDGSATASMTSDDFYVSSHAITDRELVQGSESTWYFDTDLGETDVVREFSYMMPLQDWDKIVWKDADGVSQNFRFSVTPTLTYDKGSSNSQVFWDCALQEAYIVFEGKKYFATIQPSGSNYICSFDFYTDLPSGEFVAYNYSHSIHFKVNYSALVVNDSGKTGSTYTGVFFTPELNMNVAFNSSTTWSYDLHYNDDLTGSVIQNQTEEITGALEDQKEVQQSQLEEQKEQTETQKGIAASIKEFFGSFFDNLINSIIHVIVPTKEEMGELFNRLNDFFSETFGFLYYPFEFIINAFNIFLVADSETGLTLPAFSIMGYEVWGNQTYDIASEPIVGEIFGFVRMGTGAMLVMWFVNFLKDFFDKRFGGGGN